MVTIAKEEPQRHASYYGLNTIFRAFHTVTHLSLVSALCAKH